MKAVQPKLVYPPICGRAYGKIDGSFALEQNQVQIISMVLAIITPVVCSLASPHFVVAVGAQEGV